MNQQSQAQAFNEQMAQQQFRWAQILQANADQRNTLQWKVQDAAAAGLSPLAALGSPGYTPVPAQVGSVAGADVPIPGGSSGPSLASRLGDAGQSFERALQAATSGKDRILQDINLKKAASEADFAQSQAALARLAVRKSASTPPANSSIIPDTITVQDPSGDSYSIPNPAVAHSLNVMPGGSLRWIYGNLKQNLEDIKTNVIDHNVYGPGPAAPGSYQDF